MIDLKHQQVVIAGGSSGIGLATAKLLSATGASVTITGRDAGKLTLAKKETPALHTQVLNGNDLSGLQQFFACIGKLHHLVIAVSGAKGGGPFATLPLEDLQAGFEGKFWPQLKILQAALPYLDKPGSVTLVTAASASARLAGTAGLAAINGALEAMVPILAKDLQPLRINAVSPGVIDTSWWNFLDPAAKEKLFQQFATQICTGRIGKPEEVAAAICSIITNGYINGSILHCDGGLV